MGMKILVAVASKHGSTREIAETVAQELQVQGLIVELKDVSEVIQVSSYDAVVFGSAVYAGSWLQEAKSFAEAFRTQLSKVPVWLFSSGPIGAENPKPQDDPNMLAAPLGGVKPRDHHVFVGKLDPGTLGLGERLIIKAFKSPTGDFRNWEEIRGWARGVATQLLAENAVTER
jgi:menaquinone-dependent protoporphyrinogen oxidase